MNALRQATCLALGVDAHGLEAWVRGLAETGATPDQILAKADAFGIHPLSLAVARVGKLYEYPENRTANRAFWAWLGEDPAWEKAIEGNRLRLRDDFQGDLPQGLVVPNLELCRLGQPLDLPMDLQAEGLRIYRCPWIERVPLLKGVRSLELIDLAGLETVAGGLGLTDLSLASCPRIRTLEGPFRLESLQISACRAFEFLPDALEVDRIHLNALPSLKSSQDQLPAAAGQLIWEEGEGWRNEPPNDFE